MITRVKASNIKGMSFDDALGKFTLIVGDNDSGKTARFDALRVGLLGYHPRLPQTNQGTFRLASGSPMLVDLWMGLPAGQAGDDRVKREWHLDTRTGRVSYAGCEGVRVPPVLLDARQYLGMASREKLWYVCDRVDVTKHGYSDAALLKSIETVPVNRTDTRAPQAVSGLVEQFRREIKERGKKNVTEWLRLMVDRLIAGRKQFDAGLKAMEGLIRAQPQLGDEDGPVMTVDEATKGRDRLTGKLSDLEGQLRALKKTDEDVKENKRRRERVQDDIDAITDKMITSVELNALKEQIKRRKPVSPEEKNDRCNELRNNLDRLNRDHLQSGDRIRTLTKEWEKFKKTSEDVLAGDSCPTCKSDNVSWKKSYKKWHDSEIKKRVEAIDAARKAVQETEKQIVNLNRELDAEDQRITKVREHLASVEAVRVTEEANERIALLRKSMPDMVKRPDDKKFETLEKSITEARNELELFEREHRRAIAAATDQRRQLEAQEKASVLESSRNVHKLVIAAVEAEAKRVTDIVLGQVLARARAVTGGILRGDFEYRDGEFGYYNGSTWVTHETFNGSEELIAFAGLSYALASESPLKLILMDELGRMDFVRKHKLLQRMLDMVEDGRLDQFVAIDTSLAGYAPNLTEKAKVIVL